MQMYAHEQEHTHKHCTIGFILLENINIVLVCWGQGCRWTSSGLSPSVKHDGLDKDYSIIYVTSVKNVHFVTVYIYSGRIDIMVKNDILQFTNKCHQYTETLKSTGDLIINYPEQLLESFKKKFSCCRISSDKIQILTSLCWDDTVTPVHHLDQILE